MCKQLFLVSIFHTDTFTTISPTNATRARHQCFFTFLKCCNLYDFFLNFYCNHERHECVRFNYCFFCVCVFFFSFMSEVECFQDLSLISYSPLVSNWLLLNNKFFKNKIFKKWEGRAFHVFGRHFHNTFAFKANRAKRSESTTKQIPEFRFLPPLFLPKENGNFPLL